jgi:hypothetical protein
MNERNHDRRFGYARAFRDPADVKVLLLCRRWRACEPLGNDCRRQRAKQHHATFQHTHRLEDEGAEILAEARGLSFA